MFKKVIIFFGPPGSGKGTQADKLGEKLGLPVISTGELLRHNRDAGVGIGKKAAEKLAKGRLVSNELVENILDKRLKRKDVAAGFILDGFPRDLKQLDYLKKKIFKRGNKILAIYIKVSDKEVKERISGRRVCDCGAAYHLKYNPPRQEGVCDLCGAKIYIRKDDTPRIIAGRLKRFHKRICLILDFFKKNGKLIKINGEKSIDDVQNDILKNFKL